MDYSLLFGIEQISLQNRTLPTDQATWGSKNKSPASPASGSGHLRFSKASEGGSI